jgi:molybdopterin molybdotransferase
MPEFLHLIPPSEALDRLFKALPESFQAEGEQVFTEDALGRVLAASVSAPHPLPPFARSTVDGYSLHAVDTYGATPSLPSYLKLIGEVHMGTSTEIAVGSGQAALVHTGGMIPEGADGVVKIEDTQAVGEDEIEVLKPVAGGENILTVGEDVRAGDIVIDAGEWLRPQEIGGLMALGVTEVLVARRPRVGIISTGDEVVPPDAEVSPGQIRDINSYALSALISRSGGEPIRRGIIPDRYVELLQTAQHAHSQDDIVVITAGSSVSIRDITGDVISALGEPGVLVHGVSIKPGKPTILAVADRVPIIGLPGNPVSALVVAGLFVVPLIRRWLGLKDPAIHPTIHAHLAINVVSETGREDYLPVRLVSTEEGFSAEPIFGRSNLIFTLVRADGLVRIPSEATGLSEGTEVQVILF